MYKLKITNIKCHSVGGGTEDDDVEILVQCDAGPPARFPLVGSHPMNNNDTWSPNAVYYYAKTAYISIWDRDGVGNFADAADMLGTCWVGMVAATGKKIDVYGDGGSHYTITVSCTEVESLPVPDNADLDSVFMQAIKDDLSDFVNSSLGKSVISERDPESLEALLKEALFSTAFSRFAAKLQEQEKVQGISLGLMGQVDLFGGLHGAFGVALPRSDFTLVGSVSDPDNVDTGIFAGVGFIEGVDAGIEATLAIGVWFDDPTGITGFYIGSEVDIDEGLGLTGAAFAGRDDKDELKGSDGKLDPKKIRDKAKVIFAGIDVGLGDGAEADESYFFSGVLPKDPCYQTGTYTNMAVLDDLHCHDAYSSESDNHDNIYIKYTVDDDSTEYRYPIWNTFEMSEDDDHRYLGVGIGFNDHFTVTLYVGTTAVKDTQIKVGDSQTYSASDFKSQSDVDKVFEDHEGMHHIEYHLHAVLQA